MHRFFVIFAVCAFTTTVVAADFKSYESGRFGYTIDLPSAFKTVLTPNNGDGMGLESAGGSAKLSVCGRRQHIDGLRTQLHAHIQAMERN